MTNQVLTPRRGCRLQLSPLFNQDKMSKSTILSHKANADDEMANGTKKYPKPWSMYTIFFRLEQ